MDKLFRVEGKLMVKHSKDLHGILRTFLNVQDVLEEGKIEGLILEEEYIDNNRWYEFKSENSVPFEKVMENYFEQIIPIIEERDGGKEEERFDIDTATIYFKYEETNKENGLKTSNSFEIFCNIEEYSDGSSLIITEK